MLPGKAHHLTELAEKLRQLTYEDGTPVFATVCIGPLTNNVTYPCAMLNSAFRLIYFVEAKDGTQTELQTLAIAERLVDVFGIGSPYYTWGSASGQVYRAAYCGMWTEKTRAILDTE